MPPQTLESFFDVLVVGTGLSQSITAAWALDHSLLASLLIFSESELSPRSGTGCYTWILTPFMGLDTPASHSKSSYNGFLRNLRRMAASTHPFPIALHHLANPPSLRFQCLLTLGTMQSPYLPRYFQVREILSIPLSSLESPDMGNFACSTRSA
jgi:hypothetical protein